MASFTPISATDFSTYDGGEYQKMKGVATSANGAIIYVSMSNVTGIGVMKSSDTGSTWSNVYPTTVGFNSICCNSTGTIVHAANLGDGLYTSTDSGANWSKVTFATNTLPGGAANPESPAGGQFPGYQLSNIFQIACDSTGTKLIMTTNAQASLYWSVDSGVTWSFLIAPAGYSTNPTGQTTVACNANGTTLYAALNTNTISQNIIVSNDAGVTWASINMLGLSGPFNTLSTNAYGDFVFGVDSAGDLNIFYPTHADNAVLTHASGNAFVALTNYNNGANLIITQTTPTYTTGAVVLYSVTNKYTPGQGPPCFKEDTTILCLRDGKEVYIKIQDIRKGYLVKTLKHGYMPVNMIGKSTLFNTADTVRRKDRLYVCSSDTYPEIIDDLIITGAHSILEDTLTKEQKEQTIDILGKLFITDSKYRLMACLDKRAKPYLEEGSFTIYHIALEHDNNSMNYGIYANGLLVETCCKRYLKDASGMTLIE
jgi:hypothetical protein